MRYIFFTNTNLAVGAGIEKALVNYVSHGKGKDIIVIQSQFYAARRMDEQTIQDLNAKIVTIHDYEHCISFLRQHTFTLPFYEFILPFVVRYTKFHNRKSLRNFGEADAVYLFKNEYWPLFHAKVIVGSNHGQFAFDNFFTKVLSLFVKAGIFYRGINAFHLFPRSAQIGDRMGKKYFTTPIGIDTKNYVPVARNALINILFVGRLEHIKGIDIFIEVSSRFVNRSDVKFHIAGGGSYASHLQNAISCNVQYHGTLDEKDLAQLYGSCDIFLYPTRWDAFPTVVVEAASAGDHIITSEKMSGVFDDLKNLGYLEYVDLNVDSICARLEKAISSMVSIRASSAAEHSYVSEKYDNSVVSEKLFRSMEELYSSES